MISNKQIPSTEINGLEDEFPFCGFAHCLKRTVIPKKTISGWVLFDDTSASEHLRKCHFLEVYEFELSICCPQNLFLATVAFCFAVVYIFRAKMFHTYLGKMLQSDLRIFSSKWVGSTTNYSSMAWFHTYMFHIYYILLKGMYPSKIEWDRIPTDP